MPAHVAKDRLARLLDTLEQGLVERRNVVRLAVLAALAHEHTLLIGPPGTAKSALAQRLHLAFRDARYFERLLTRFTVPEELFGPLSIRALEEDRYERHTAGFLPDASIAFVDEVFKANSAILNALLTLLNERLFDNGAGRQRCPLISLIGATNAVPADAKDWFAKAKEHPGSWWTDWAAWLKSNAGKLVAAPKAYGNRGHKVIEPAPGRYVKQKA